MMMILITMAVTETSLRSIVVFPSNGRFLLLTETIKATCVTLNEKSHCTCEAREFSRARGTSGTPCVRTCHATLLTGILVVSQRVMEVVCLIVRGRKRYGYHQRENTGSRLFTEVKPCWTGLISGWVTI